ncbi:coiled-coil domain-containing protein 7 [Otolemur garnettii]|uniref:coiled-coil domain-containing protein 7 n=1 Tax=Otolemur garnettii TaxID=30611 RepID=UPI000C7F139D|nr:coiled-coil domain-containing protein 7 [Otolemur garnettii]
MNSAKYLLTTSKKLASVPELRSSRSVSVKLPSPPYSKRRNSAKVVHDRIEPMVLRSPPTGGSVVQYALPIPSSRIKDILAEDEMLVKITRHLKSIVATLEDAYGADIQSIPKAFVRSDQEDLCLSVGDDLSSFLTSCSHLAEQLEAAVKEEDTILESLFKWFQWQVNQMEEISKDKTFSEAEFHKADKDVTLSIRQIVGRVQKLEELRVRLKTKTAQAFKAMLHKPPEKEVIPEDSSEVERKYELIEHKIEENSYSITHRLNIMLEIFEDQANMLERAINDLSVLEAKYKQMQSDFEGLSREKLMLENELQKLTETETIIPKTKPGKKTAKGEKKKDKRKSEDLEDKKSPDKELKIKEDLLQVQKIARTLEIENTFLKEQLKQALEESERVKQQLNKLLNKEEELPKSEGNTSATVERSSSRIKVKGVDSKNTLFEKEERKSVVSDSAGPTAEVLIKEQSQVLWSSAMERGPCRVWQPTICKQLGKAGPTSTVAFVFKEAGLNDKENNLNGQQ